ncbi:uncharacterized protein [Misgurnus anguillicaudatus]|uniref:uncharacterized protein n=1 Tax=Misgurnus anguillicaudatus TaxID=75329 RepID=UPI003CCF4F61
MSSNRHPHNHRHNENDEESDIIYKKRLRRGQHPIDFHVSSDVNKNLLKKDTWKIKKETTKKPNVQLASANVDILDTINIIDTIDRPACANAESKYARCGKYAVGLKNKPMERIPKAGVYAEAGVGRARAQVSVFEAEANGPNASVGAEASLVGVGAMARAEVASASAKAGPVGVKVGLGVDTGAAISLSGVEAKILGTGISIGPKTSVAVLGSEVSCSVM